MKIGVVTGTRAEFGLLSSLMHKIATSPTLELKTFVTGAHLIDEFGSTVNDVTAAGFKIDAVISEISEARNGEEVALQVGAGITAFTKSLKAVSPDALVVLGDRFEILAASIAAFFLNIPIVHLHGGEVTSGSFDDSIRHSISQLARVHAVAAPAYGRRLIRAGADPSSVHVVGGFGVDALARTELLLRTQLERELGIHLSDPILLVTYHPVTAAEHDTRAEIENLLASLAKVPDATVVLTLPNGDPEHHMITPMLREASENSDNWHIFSSLGHQKYLSLMALSAAVIGNSSSGIIEAPALGIPTVDIGPRQEGRASASSIIHCDTSEQAISEAIFRALLVPTPKLEAASHPYGPPGAAHAVLELLETIPFSNLGHKKYYDPPTED